MTMKKGAVCSAALLALIGTSAFAAPNVANVTQKGSLLVFPLIDTSDGRDTIIFVANDSNRPVRVKCYYGVYDPNDRFDGTKAVTDFGFTLTANQPLVWKASSPFETGVFVAPFPPIETRTGQLICYATNNAGNKHRRFNHLYGMAKVVDIPDGQSWEYSAYSFHCKLGKDRRDEYRASCGEPGVLRLDGNYYDRCGQYLLGQMISTGAGEFLEDELLGDNENFLSVSACDQNLTRAAVGEADFNAQTLVFTVWNQFENPFTGTSEEIDGWWRIYLGVSNDEVENHNPLDSNAFNFEYVFLRTPAARYRAEAYRYICSDGCGWVPGSGLLGVQVQFHEDVGYSATTSHVAGKKDGAIIYKTGSGFVPEGR